MSDSEPEAAVEFSGGDAGSSATIPVQCSALRKGGFVCIKGRPCKITDMSTSKTGKHGHAKVNLVGVDIFTGKKLEDMSPSTHNMDVPRVVRKDFQLCDIDGDHLSLMNEDGSMKEDVKVPEGELGDEIRAKFGNEDQWLVTVIAAMGEEAAIAIKPMPK
jgi:translation initiation factor 5A